MLRALRDELAWARDRHSAVLDELDLLRLRVGDIRGDVIASVDRLGVILRRSHRLVQQAILDRGEDPVVIAILAAGVYTVMNYEAEAIVDDDERAFVGQLAAGLADAAAVHARGGEAGPSVVS